VLPTAEAMTRLVREVVQDAAAAGAIWIEPAFYPDHHPLLGDSAQAIDLVLAAGLAAGTEFGVGFGLMVAADRTVDPAQAERLAQIAAERTLAGVVSFGLANDEAIGPPEPFAAAFDIAHDAGLLCTPHAGELAGPESVRGALDRLHANRIQHGVRSIEDPELVRRLAIEGICLDVCPTINVLLSVVPSLAEHPLRALLDAGVRCSINADDPLLFGPGLLEEYEICRDVLGLSDEQLAAVARSSLECSGASAELVATGVASIEAWLA
jgi:adenosine deaminase